MPEFFFELLQIAVGNRKTLSAAISPAEWSALHNLSIKQSLEGVCFSAIQIIKDKRNDYGASIGIEKPLYLKWLASAVLIGDKNKVVNECCSSVASEFRERGLWCCVLKGQGNLEYYPEWLRSSRTPGDIDLWLNYNTDRTNITHILGQIQDCLVSHGKMSVLIPRYHHVSIPRIFDVEVEIHYRPTFVNAPIRNRRITHWYSGHIRNCSHEFQIDGQSFPVPSVGFNVIYQLLHIFHHFFDEGVGLRQLLDYYFTIQEYEKSGHEDLHEVRRLIKRFGLEKFAAAVMWILQRVFLMPDSNCLIDPDEKGGKFLLNEVMLAGNFGKYDPRIKRQHGAPFKVMLNRALYKTKRLSKFICKYPEETISEPFFRLYHLIWRRMRLWRFLSY
ncbi:MAG: nucleotidyltransferase family protein [Bacteroidales bacterium]|nr:nucleotidyltransferase family protein [Candidatus Cryptobacteroides choladohippi]